jgi:hypothetical protein
MAADVITDGPAPDGATRAPRPFTPSNAPPPEGA